MHYCPRLQEELLQKRVPSIPPNSHLVAHATLCSIGFMILLPLGTCLSHIPCFVELNSCICFVGFAGAIIGRYRTVNPFWFNIHAAVQILAGLLIIPGFALGVNFKNKWEDLGAVTSSQHNVRRPFYFYPSWLV